MDHIDEIHQEHIELESNIQFYKQEINFLLKILTKEYAISITHGEVVKLLDYYWKEFEKQQLHLKELELKIKNRNNDSMFFCKRFMNTMKYDEGNEKAIFNEYVKIVTSLKAIKKSLYKYLESDVKNKLTLSLL